MLGGSVQVVFEERSLTANPPGCVEAIAAALMLGYRLLPKPHVNHEDVILGDRLKRLQHLKDAKARELRREVRWYFLPTSRSIYGEKMPTPVKQFFLRWSAEPMLRRAITTDDRYAAFRDRIHALLSKDRRAGLAQENSRFCYGKIGGEAETLADFANMMEEGLR